MKSIITRLVKAAKTFLKSDKDSVEDIVVFGSLMKGKEKPEDIDILIIFKKTIDKKIETEFKEKINLENTDINSTTIEEFRSEGFIAKEGVYLEGFSLINENQINEQLGFSSIALIKYKLNNIKGSKRILFYYALQGRNNQKGFLKEIGAKRFSEGIIACDYSVLEKAKPFFDQWKIEYTVIPSLIPKRLKKIIL